MTMSTTNTSVSGTSASAKWIAPAIAVVMFIVYYGLIRAITPLIAPLAMALPMPSGAPPAWWYVFQRVVTVGSADLIAAVLPVWVYLHLRGRRLRDLGFTRAGTARAWGLVLAAQAGLVWFDLHMGPVGRVADPLNAYALAASAVVGPAAAFSEEIFFRGYVMDELRRGGFGVAVQVTISMLLFGGAHIAYLSTPSGWTILVFTGLVGGLWSLVYVLGGRSLWPAVVAHIINDAVVIPSAFYMIARAAGH